MRNFRRTAVLFTCILSLQMIKPVAILYANTMTLVYDGKQHIYKNPPITLQIEGKTIETSVMPPVQINDRTLVPTREVFEPMRASVEWKAAEKKVFINYGKTLMILEVNNQDVWVDGETLQLDVPPKIINDKVMLPLRFIGEALGFEVEWNNEIRNVNIKQKKKDPVIGDTIPLITTVKDLQVSDLDSISSLFTIYFEKPIENYNTFEHNGNIVVDVPGAKNLLSSRLDFNDNLHISAVRTSQFTTDTARIVFDMKGQADYKFELGKDRKTLMLQISSTLIPDSDPLYQNMEYKYSPREVFVFKKAAGITIDTINVKDDYRNRKIIVTLPNSYSQVYGSGVMNVGSNNIDRIQIQNKNKTEFIIHQRKIRAFDIIDDGENINIIFMEPREKHDKIIVLDMGHGGSDGGASGNGLLEKNLNFEQGMHVYRLLENNPDIKVYVTREDDTYPTNPFRAELANEIGADIFISMHNNSFTAHIKGTEVLYSVSSPISKQIAEILQRNMTNQLGTFNRGAKPRPDLIVLNSTNMPAVLIETAFLSNLEDAEKLKSPEFNRKVGQVVYDSIIEIFNTLSFR